MTSIRAWLAVPVCAALAVTAACGGSDGGNGTATPPAAASAAASAAPSATAPMGTPLVAQPTSRPTVSLTEVAYAEELKGLRALTLTALEVPFGFKLRSDQPVTRTDASTALIGVPELSGFLKASDMAGAWATFYTREQPASALSGIVYQFGTAQSSTAFVTTIAGLTGESYPGATSVERVQADKVGDLSQMMRYRFSGARTLEYTWAQGTLAGQIVLRYTGDVEGPDDVALVVSLARKQAEHMRGLPQ